MRACYHVCTRFFIFLVLLTAACGTERQRVVLATTTSLEDTGLLDTLTAAFEAGHPPVELSPSPSQVWTVSGAR